MLLLVQFVVPFFLKIQKQVIQGNENNYKLIKYQ